MRRGRLWVIVTTSSFASLLIFFLEPWARIEISFRGPGPATTTEGLSAIQGYGNAAFIMWIAAAASFVVALLDGAGRWRSSAPRWYAGLGLVQCVALTIGAITGPRLPDLEIQVAASNGPLLWVALVIVLIPTCAALRASMSPLHATPVFGDDGARTQDDNRGTDA